MIPTSWFTGIVTRGDQTGHQLGFPTVNFNKKILSGHEIKEGIYAARVKYNDTNYIGALYFGPRLVKGETVAVLEIHILDFSKMIYGADVSFQLVKYIHEPKDYGSMEALRKALKKDIEDVRGIFTAEKSE